jgi:hypothetical protein
MRAAVGPHPDFWVSFRFRLMGMGAPLLVIMKGNLALTAAGLGLFA